MLTALARGVGRACARGIVASAPPATALRRALSSVARQAGGPKLIVLTPKLAEKEKMGEVRFVAPAVEGASASAVISVEEAIGRASDLKLDLVLVNAKAVPPVVKAMDVKAVRRAAKAKAMQKQEEDAKLDNLKEKGMRIKPNISDHDLEIKTRKMLGFLEKGNKLNVQIQSTGRIKRTNPDGVKKILRRVDEILEGRYSKKKQMGNIDWRVQAIYFPLRGAGD